MINDIVGLINQLNFLELLGLLKPFIFYFAAARGLKVYSIHKELKPKNISKIILPPELTREYSDIELEHITSEKLKDSILRFTTIAKNNYPDDDLINFYNNINELNVEIKDFKVNRLKGSIQAGGYAPGLNKLRLCSHYENGILFHELFHLASAIKGGEYAGFFIASKKMGVGIDEGYTELLTERDFKVADPYISDKYIYMMAVVNCLENVVGKQKMTSLYFHANLRGLIEEIKKYISEEEIMQFLANTDFVFNNMFDKGIPLYLKYILELRMRDINKFLTNICAKKLMDQAREGLITYEDAFNKIALYISSLPSIMRVGKNVLDTNTDKYMVEWLNPFFEDLPRRPQITASRK